MGLEGDMNRYYKEIKKHLTCSRKTRDDFLAEAHWLVDDLLENQPDATYEDVIKSIGSPEELAETFLNTLPNRAEIKKYHQRRKKHRFFLAALISLFIIVLIGIIIYIGQTRYHTVVTEETTTVIGSVSSS